MNVDELQAKDSEGRRKAEEKLQSLVQSCLATQQAVVGRVMQTVIKDRLVYPMKMDFSWSLMLNGRANTLVLNYLKDEAVVETCTIHPHAISQMATKVGMPQKFATDLRTLGSTWRLSLLAHNLNELFHQQPFLDRHNKPAMFLHRLVGGEIRGFLSRSYNRHLDTRKLLKAFLDACKEHNAMPVEALASDTRTSLKCMLPYVFEPVHGEFIGIGLTFANSDFGVGKARVSGTIVRVKSGTVTVVEDNFSRVHLSSVIESDDVELSDATMDKEAEAHTSALRDAVKKVLSYESVDHLLKAVATAHENEIPWHRLKNLIGKILTKKEVDFIEEILKGGADSIIELPPLVRKQDENIATGWWASNVLGWMAKREESEDRKEDLQLLAGEVLSA